MGMTRTIWAVALLLSCAGAGAATLAGRVVSISDGDTITVLVSMQPVKVRLTEIDTPEKAQPWGSRSREALSAKIFGKTVEVRSEGTDRYGRTLGRLFVDGRDVNREMIREGHAWAYRQYLKDQSLLADEEYARTNKLGLWGLPEAQQIPPWKWRHGGSSAVTTAAPAPAVTEGDQVFTCTGKRYCHEMSSCAEARFYLANCGIIRLDGDRDGVPCETICN
jgi:endonuclease YncB( thermonuclease family)